MPNRPRNQHFKKKMKSTYMMKIIVKSKKKIVSIEHIDFFVIFAMLSIYTLLLQESTSLKQTKLIFVNNHILRTKQPMQ